MRSREAAALAEAAFPAYAATDPASRAAFLEACAEAILAIGDELIVRAMAETGLPRARLEGERGRTVGQLRLFAQVVRQGDWLDATIDPALPERTPLPRPDLRRRQRRARPGRGVRRLELPARVLGRRRRHRLGARRRLPGDRQGAFGASGHGRAGRRAR